MTTPRVRRHTENPPPCREMFPAVDWNEMDKIHPRIFTAVRTTMRSPLPGTVKEKQYDVLILNIDLLRVAKNAMHPDDESFIRATKTQNMLRAMADDILIEIERNEHH